MALCKVTQVHDDGDISLQCGNDHFILTTDAYLYQRLDAYTQDIIERLVGSVVKCSTLSKSETPDRWLECVGGAFEDRGLIESSAEVRPSA